MPPNESDDTPMLAAPGLRNFDSPLQSSVELSAFTVPAVRQADYGYFSGPLRPANRNFLSDPLGSNKSFSGPLNTDRREYKRTLSSIASMSNGLRRRQTGTHEHLLRSGQLGKCNDPFCTTCPLYWEENYVEAYPISSPDQKVHLNLVGKTTYFLTRAYTWSMGLVPGVMNPHTKRVQQWNKFFIIGCLLGVFVDPLFFFILQVDSINYCIFVNITFAKVITILRSLTDGVYFLHILLQFRLAFNRPSSGIGPAALNDNPIDIVHHYLSGFFGLDIFVVLPLPQVMVWVVVPKVVGKAYAADFAKNLLRVIVLAQYVPRMIRFVPLLAGNAPTGFIFETAWANFFVNLFLFLLVAHVVGSCWYLLGLQRVNQCLQDACVNATTEQCDMRFLDCGDGKNITEMMTKINATLWGNWKTNTNASNCFQSTSGVFVYGIYGSAVSVTFNTTFVEKYVYSLFWGFQQISTLCGNQVPSLFIGEVVFVLGIVVLGLLLVVLLIGNMQNFLLSLSRRRVEMQLRRHDVEAWMTRRQLPANLRRKVQQAERFRWAVNRGLNEEEVLKRLPENIEKEARKALCRDLIKRVRLFSFMEDQVLDAISERLRQRLYIEGSIILRMKYPIDKMHFFARGRLRSVGEDQSVVLLQDGDFCGDELLAWCLERDSDQPSGKRARQRPVMGHHALSTRTVECIGNVEAFSLDVSDLEEVAKLYSRSLRNARVQGEIRYCSPYWRTRSATTIQVAWRYWKKRLRRQSRLHKNYPGPHDIF